MIFVLTAIYLLLCLLLMVAVLLQQGKGASMGILAGAGQTWFGPAGSKTLLMKVTLWLAAGFLVVSVLLSLAAGRRSAPALPAPPPTAPAR